MQKENKANANVNEITELQKAIKMPEYHYLYRRPWYGRTTLWLSVMATGLSLYLAIMEYPIATIAMVISPITIYIGKEWHNDIKH